MAGQGFQSFRQVRQVPSVFRNWIRHRRELVGYDEAIKNGVDLRNDFNATSVKLKKQEALLKDFCKQTGIGVQSNRNQVYKFSQSVSQKAVWANKNHLQKLPEKRIIKVTEEFTKLNPVKLPDGTLATLVKGSKIVDIEVFAGKGAKKDLRVKDFLVKNYGGKADEWQHTKGHGYIDMPDGAKKANIHWLEEKTVGIVEIKLKGWSKK